MELRIVGRFGAKNLPLELRMYEALRMSELAVSTGEWNQHGRHYNIRGIHNLSRTPGISLELADSVEEDLEAYKKSRRRQK